MVSNKFSGNPLTDGIAVIIITIVLSATLIYELLGPVITKIALQKAGEFDESTLAYKNTLDIFKYLMCFFYSFLIFSS